MKYLAKAFALLLCLALIFSFTGCGTPEDTLPPSIPSGISMTTPGNDNTPTFTWDAATDDDSGVDYYLVNIDGGGWTNGGNVTTYTLNSALSDGSHTFEIVAVDKIGNQGNKGSLTFTIATDTTAPSISGIVVSVVSTSSVTIAWATDEPATGQVEYGLTSAYGSSSETYAGLVTSHSVTLTGLASGTTYHYKVKTKDASNNLATSSDGTFTTRAAIGYSRSNPAPIGMTLTTQFSLIGDTFTAEVTVLQVIRGQQAWDLILAANMLNDPPPSGYEYVLVKIRFHLISSSPSPDTLFDWYYFEVVSSGGVKLDLPFVVEPDPTLQDVYPGGTTEGWEGLTVEIGDSAPVLTFGTDSGSTSRIWFKLYS